MSLRDDLIKEIKAFLKEADMSPSTFGEEAIGDRALMITLAKGRDLKIATVERIRKFIAAERAKPRSKKAA